VESLLGVKRRTHEGKSDTALVINRSSSTRLSVSLVVYRYGRPRAQLVMPGSAEDTNMSKIYSRHDTVK
jgi:hypothetical protein